MLASVRVAITSGASLSQTLLATAGDRLALVHQDFSLVDGARRLSEIETLLITEVDAEGRIVATIAFDPDDRRAASIEMFERYFRGEGARFTPPAAIEVVRALNEHDLGAPARRAARRLLLPRPPAHRRRSDRERRRLRRLAAPRCSSNRAT